ncbi:uncharacterized protein [Miscanthus floridulus]|uniref:uncharacterized protein isoform X2 n=1 Tax=Miscanthus floridulus TaxID=154761 RepID=UPI003459168A
MALRSFSRLLTRSFYPRRAKVESSPGIVSQAASMLVAGTGRPARSLHTIRGVGAGDSAYGAAAVVAAALTGGAGILIFKKRPDDAVDGDVTMEDIKKEEVGIKKDMGKHQMDVVEAKFHEWMEKVGREYPNEEEKAYRFELFKERLKETETFTEEGRGKNSFPCFADMTDDEIRAITNCHKPRSKEYEASLMRMKKKMDERMLLIEKEKAKRNVVNCSKQ